MSMLPSFFSESQCVDWQPGCHSRHLLQKWKEKCICLSVHVHVCSCAWVWYLYMISIYDTHVMWYLCIAHRHYKYKISHSLLSLAISALARWTTSAGQMASPPRMRTKRSWATRDTLASWGRRSFALLVWVIGLSQKLTHACSHHQTKKEAHPYKCSWILQGYSQGDSQQHSCNHMLIRRVCSFNKNL